MKLKLGMYGKGVVRRAVIVLCGLATLIMVGIWRYHSNFASLFFYIVQPGACPYQYCTCATHTRQRQVERVQVGVSVALMVAAAALLATITTLFTHL